MLLRELGTSSGTVSSHPPMAIFYLKVNFLSYSSHYQNQFQHRVWVGCQQNLRILLRFYDLLVISWIFSGFSRAVETCIASNHFRMPLIPRSLEIKQSGRPDRMFAPSSIQHPHFAHTITCRRLHMTLLHVASHHFLRPHI